MLTLVIGDFLFAEESDSKGDQGVSCHASGTLVLSGTIGQRGSTDMANFRTHMTVGVVASGLLSTVAMAAALVTPSEALVLTMAGAVGGILPDIDLEKSKQSGYIFGGLGVFFAFVTMFRYSQSLSIAELWLMWIGIFVLVRYVIWKGFHGFTVHRGVFHSLLASIVFGLVAVVLFSNLLHKTPTVSWMAGGFVTFGCLVHLLLDEMYSIDFGNNRVKRSFGTALKLFDYKNPLSAGALIGVGALAYMLTPASEDFFGLFNSPDNWAYLRNRLLPAGSWFDLKAMGIQLSWLQGADQAAGEVTRSAN